MADHHSPVAFPRAPIDALADPLRRFLRVEAASGMVLLLAAAAALALANLPTAERFLGFWDTRLAFRIGGFAVDHSLKHWVSDGLMAVFFFVVGLEIKRELVLGQLRDPRQAALPLAAALGGMAVPAAVYLGLTAGDPAMRGWGIPMATDIAFVVGCLALFGSRLPAGVKVFLVSVAIVDDVGAILVIAIGYTSALNATALSLGGAGLFVILACRYAGVRAVPAYVALGAAVWLAFHESGVHATVAGIILGLLTPAHPWVAEHRFARFVEHARQRWRGDAPPAAGAAPSALERAAREARSPLDRLETTLHPWSAFAIMPIFALANAGVPIQVSLLLDPVALAVAAGLVLGKPIGILVFSAAALRTGVARLPDGVTWGTLLGGSFLTGIGFTMALFIAELALEGDALVAAKVGVIGASAVSAAAGLAILAWALPRPR
jgi:NhaA family Na+:H+ antiporter